MVAVMPVGALFIAMQVATLPDKTVLYMVDLAVEAMNLVPVVMSAGFVAMALQIGQAVFIAANDFSVVSDIGTKVVGMCGRDSNAAYQQGSEAQGSAPAYHTVHG